MMTEQNCFCWNCCFGNLIYVLLLIIVIAGGVYSFNINHKINEINDLQKKSLNLSEWHEECVETKNVEKYAVIEKIQNARILCVKNCDPIFNRCYKDENEDSYVYCVIDDVNASLSSDAVNYLWKSDGDKDADGVIYDHVDYTLVVGKNYGLVKDKLNSCARKCLIENIQLPIIHFYNESVCIKTILVKN